MRDEKQLRLVGTGRAAVWHVGKAGKDKPAAQKGQEVPSDISAALEQLEQRFQPRVIDNLDLKLQVLDKLVDLMDPTIGNVLSQIRVDLQQAA